MADLKTQIKELMNQRASLEDEISECSQRLETAGVGLKDALVDREVRD